MRWGTASGSVRFRPMAAGPSRGAAQVAAALMARRLPPGSRPPCRRWWLQVRLAGRVGRGAATALLIEACLVSLDGATLRAIRVPYRFLAYVRTPWRVASNRFATWRRVANCEPDLVSRPLNPDATQEDLRGAKGELEELLGTTRRIFGNSHPRVELVRNLLEKANRRLSTEF